MLVSSGRVDTFLKRPIGGFLGIAIRILVQTLRPFRVICELDHGDTELVVKSRVGHREPKNDMLSQHYRYWSPSSPWLGASRELISFTRGVPRGMSFIKYFDLRDVGLVNEDDIEDGLVLLEFQLNGK